jgi:hypothetical protein
MWQRIELATQRQNARGHEPAFEHPLGQQGFRSSVQDTNIIDWPSRRS